MRFAVPESSGDGTVPVRSGEAPRRGGKANILQQFVVATIPHEGAYKQAPAQLVTHYALTKLPHLRIYNEKVSNFYFLFCCYHWVRDEGRKWGKYVAKYW